MKATLRPILVPVAGSLLAILFLAQPGAWATETSGKTPVPAAKSAAPSKASKPARRTLGRGAGDKTPSVPYNNVVVYTSNDIQRSGAGTLDQFLRRTPGGRRQ